MGNTSEKNSFLGGQILSLLFAPTLNSVACWGLYDSAVWVLRERESFTLFSFPASEE